MRAVAVPGPPPRPADYARHDQCRPSCCQAALVEGRLPRPDPVLGHRLFADGVSRPVRLDAAGQQDVVGPNGGRVPGVWVLPPDVPSDPPPCCHGGEALRTRVLPALGVALLGVTLLTLPLRPAGW